MINSWIHDIVEDFKPENKSYMIKKKKEDTRAAIMDKHFARSIHRQVKRQRRQARQHTQSHQSRRYIKRFNRRWTFIEKKYKI